MKLVSKLFLIIMLGIPFITQAQDRTAYDKGLYAAKGDTLPYRILFPLQFNPTEKYPVVIILHGAGERGKDNNAQLTYGADLFLRPDIRQQYRAIVIFPQCPAESFWSNVDIEHNDVTGKNKFLFKTDDSAPTKAMAALLGFTDELLKKPYIDKKQIYIGGLSMGGMGTLEMLGRKPNLFAAAIAICGGDNSLNVPKYAKKVPLWVFHGGKDPIVPADHSEVVVAALKAEGANPKFSLYPNVGHDSWNNAFAEAGLLPWLFSNKK